jgi:hypothetical protein
VAANYQWHWTFNNNPIGDDEIASGQCIFPVDGDTGKATVTFIFRYLVDDGGGNVARLSGTTLTTISHVANSSPYSSSLTITSSAQ